MNKLVITVVVLSAIPGLMLYGMFALTVIGPMFVIVGLRWLFNVEAQEQRAKHKQEEADKTFREFMYKNGITKGSL